MTTYVNIPTTDIDQDSPVTQPLMVGMRDNLLAVVEGDPTTAVTPIVAAGWHPYDKTTVGGSEDGLIYDHSVDGTVSSILTPDFEDGYEYALLLQGISSTITATFNVDGYFETSAAYGALYTSSTSTASTAGAGVYGLAYYNFPRWVSREKTLTYAMYHNTSTGSAGTFEGGISGAYSTSAAQPLLRGRLRFTNGNIDGGTIYMLRRREYADG